MCSDTEIMLNRQWIHKSGEDEAFAELNFVIDFEYFKRTYHELFGVEQSDIENFLDGYEPEVDGEKIYQRAKIDNAVVNELYTYVGLFQEISYDEVIRLSKNNSLPILTMEAQNENVH